MDLLTLSLRYSGNGAVVGILKMGPKKLFVYDHNGIQHEMQPLCVLDFYVHESRQRTGCGKKLFEHMLQVRLQGSKLMGMMIRMLMITYRVRMEVPGAQDSLELSCSSLKFLQGTQKCTGFYTQHF